ncbi:MAG: acylphosphatase [Pirellulales bacterium]|nr:acylphosphatase [Pirellulales bacterium]
MIQISLGNQSMGGSGRVIRCDVHYTGLVQGVGFRYTTLSIARRYQVTGYVQNLLDGRVRLVVEGVADEVEAMLQAVADRMQDCIRDIDCQQLAPTGEFARFELRYER